MVGENSNLNSDKVSISTYDVNCSRQKQEEKYVVILDNPWMKKGTIISREDDPLMEFEKYPNIFLKIEE